MRFLLTSLFLISNVFLVPHAFSGVEVSPDIILKKADDVRNPSETFQMTASVSNADSNIPTVFSLAMKGKDKTLIKTLEPARDKGRNLLMLGEEMWAYIPNLKRALRVSLNQKLTGQAANGDLSRMRWYGDYAAKIEKESAQDWTLLLIANKKGLTYDKVRATIAKNTFRPLKAEYLSLGGKSLKIAEFGGYKSIAGEVRPTEIVIQDTHNSAERSVISIQNMELSDFPDSYFTQDNLK